MKNAPWQVEALARLPDFAEEIRKADTPYQMWIDLHFAFEGAYDSGNSDLVARIYQFARWCCDQPRGKVAADDLLTCVAVSFYEHIPMHPKALKDMPKWWSLEDVRTMKEIFSYLGGPARYEEVLAQFRRRKAKRGRGT